MKYLLSFSVFELINTSEIISRANTMKNITHEKGNCKLLILIFNETPSELLFVREKFELTLSFPQLANVSPSFGLFPKSVRYVVDISWHYLSEFSVAEDKRQKLGNHSTNVKTNYIQVCSKMVKRFNWKCA